MGWKTSDARRCDSRRAKKTRRLFVEFSVTLEPSRSFTLKVADPKTDPRLQALRAGDKAAFDSLYAEHRARVYGFLLRLSGDRHVAADLFQNVWLKLARTAPRLREDTYLVAWLLTVARNEYIDYQRARVLDLSRFLAWGRQPAEAATSSPDGLRRDIEQALRALGDADREVLLLVAADGLSPSEAAGVLGVTPTALRQRLTRARRRFAQALDQERQPDATGRAHEGRLGS